MCRLTGSHHTHFTEIRTKQTVGRRSAGPRALTHKTQSASFISGEQTNAHRAANMQIKHIRIEQW